MAFFFLTRLQHKKSVNNATGPHVKAGPRRFGESGLGEACLQPGKSYNRGFPAPKPFSTHVKHTCRFNEMAFVGAKTALAKGVSFRKGRWLKTTLDEGVKAHDRVGNTE